MEDKLCYGDTFSVTMVSKSQIKYEQILAIVAIVMFSIVFDYNARQGKKDILFGWQRCPADIKYRCQT